MKSKALGYQIHDEIVDPLTSKDPSPFSREEMIVQYTPLIKFIAHRLAMRLPSHILVEDLNSAGVIGLMDAITKFDPNKNVEFKTYAGFRIRGAMLDELRTLDWIPRSVRQKATQMERTILQLERKRGRLVEDEEIASELDLSLEDYYHLISEINGVSLLDTEVLQQKISKLSADEILNILIAEKESDPFHQFSLKEIKRVLARAIEELSPKEKLVISLYYYDELTLKEIGEVLDLTESRICQIHTKGILKLRAKLKRHLKDTI